MKAMNCRHEAGETIYCESSECHKDMHKDMKQRRQSIVKNYKWHKDMRQRRQSIVKATDGIKTHAEISPRGTATRNGRRSADLPVVPEQPEPV